MGMACREPVRASAWALAVALRIYCVAMRCGAMPESPVSEAIPVRSPLTAWTVNGENTMLLVVERVLRAEDAKSETSNACSSSMIR